MRRDIVSPQFRQFREPCAEYLNSVVHIENVLCSILALALPVNKDLLGQKGYRVCNSNPTGKCRVFDMDRLWTVQEKLNVSQLLGRGARDFHDQPAFLLAIVFAS